MFCLFCLRGIRRGLGVTTDRLFGIHTAVLFSLHMPPSHPVSFPPSLWRSLPRSHVPRLFTFFSTSPNIKAPTPPLSLKVNWRSNTQSTSLVFFSYAAPFKSSGAALKRTLIGTRPFFFFFREHSLTAEASSTQEERRYLVPRPTSCGTRAPDP